MLPLRSLTALSALALGAVLCAGCDRASHTEPAPDVSAVALASSDPNRDVGRLFGDLENAEQRLRPLPPEPLPHVCPAPTPELNEAERVAPVSVRDTRGDARTLLPLSVVERLESGARRQFEREFLAADFVRGAVPKLASRARATEAIAALRRRAAQRYRAVFHVKRFEEARLIVRAGKNRLEWIPGVFSARLALHDARGGEPLCEVEVSVQSDLVGVRASRRLEAPTSTRLRGALADALAEKGAAELSVAAPWLSLEPRPKQSEKP